MKKKNIWKVAGAFIFFVCILIGICVFISNRTNARYDGWVTVTMKKCGTIKFPAEWEVKYDDSFYVVRDTQSGEVRFVGYEKYNYNKEAGTFEFNAGGYDISIANQGERDYYDSKIFSNSATWGRKTVAFNGVKTEKAYYIELENDESCIEYICVNKMDITDELMDDIARSYVGEYH